MLKAPTGSGKTEVMLRVALAEALRSGGYVCLVAPTRDLVRQDCTYFRDRLAGTGLEVGEVHAGVTPATNAAPFSRAYATGPCASSSAARC